MYPSVLPVSHTALFRGRRDQTEKLESKLMLPALFVQEFLACRDKNWQKSQQFSSGTRKSTVDLWGGLSRCVPVSVH